MFANSFTYIKFRVLYRYNSFHIRLGSVGLYLKLGHTWPIFLNHAMYAHKQRKSSEKGSCMIASKSDNWRTSYQSQLSMLARKHKSRIYALCPKNLTALHQPTCFHKIKSKARFTCTMLENYYGVRSHIWVTRGYS